MRTSAAEWGCGLEAEWRESGAVAARSVRAQVVARVWGAAGLRELDRTGRGEGRCGALGLRGKGRAGGPRELLLALGRGGLGRTGKEGEQVVSLFFFILSFFIPFI